jgi:hypothetical protein
MKHIHIILLVLVIVVCCITIMFQTNVDKENFLSQSGLAGTDNLDTSIDPSKSSCMYYVKNKRGWGDLFGDDEDGRKRQYAISGMQSLRTMYTGLTKDTPIPFMDACVVPTELKASYNIDDMCKMQTKGGETQLTRTTANMIPDGCVVDFSNGSMTKDGFSGFLMNAYQALNYHNEMTIKNLRESVQQQQTKIEDLGNVIASKDASIGELNGTLSLKDLEVRQRSGETPSFMYKESYGNWIEPIPNNQIATMRTLGISSPSDMSITFWLDIKKTHWDFRNIFHVTTKYRDGPLERAYDSEEDMQRRPSVFILPNTYGIHICHDTNKPQSDKNTYFNVDNISGQNMIGLVWSGRTLTVYVNDNRVETYVYQYDLLTPDPAASLFFCSRFYSHGDFMVKNLSFYNTALSKEMYMRKFQQES